MKPAATIAILTVRGPDYHPTRRLIQAAEQRGARAMVLNPYTVRPGLEKGRPMIAGLSGQGLPDIVMPRQGAEIRDRCLPLLAHLEFMGATMVNGLSAVRLARHQFLTLQALAVRELPVPDTRFVNAVDGFQAAMAVFGPNGAVVKPVSGRQGTGICRLAAGQLLPEDLTPHLNDGKGLLVQRLIDPAGRRDIRVMVVGKKAIAAMVLQPAAGDFRANFHLTGHARPLDLTDDMADLACRAAAALGLDIAGVDVMVDADHRPWIVEVNYAPGFKGLEQATGQDIAGDMIDFALHRHTQRTNTAFESKGQLE